MTLLHKVEITASGRGHDSTIKLDGRDVSAGVRRFTLEQEAGKVSSLELEVLVIETARVEAEDVHVWIGAASEDLLKRLGWTPPEEYPKGVNVSVYGKLEAQPLDPEDFAQAMDPAHNQ